MDSAARSPTRRHHRFKDSITGSIHHLGTCYACRAKDISQRGLHLLSDAEVVIGDRLKADLEISENIKFACVLEVRQVTSDGLGAQIIDITEADASVLNARLEAHYAAVRRAKAERAAVIKQP